MLRSHDESIFSFIFATRISIHWTCQIWITPGLTPRRVYLVKWVILIFPLFFLLWKIRHISYAIQIDTWNYCHMTVAIVGTLCKNRWKITNNRLQIACHLFIHSIPFCTISMIKWLKCIIVVNVLFKFIKFKNPQRKQTKDIKIVFIFMDEMNCENMP